MESENNPNYVGLIFLGIIKYLFASFFIFILLMLMNNNPGSGGSYRNVRKSCFSNISFLSGAVEMYNMDNSAKINELNNSTIKILIDNKYLKKSFIVSIYQKTNTNPKVIFRKMDLFIVNYMVI